MNHNLEPVRQAVIAAGWGMRTKLFQTFGWLDKGGICTLHYELLGESLRNPKRGVVIIFSQGLMVVQ